MPERLNALLRKNNEKLLNKVAKSRFCRFAEILRDPEGELFGYDVYFKFGKCG